MVTIVNGIPEATAEIRGSEKYNSIRGNVDFYDTYEGTVIVVEIYGIPNEIEKESNGFLGFHIHEGGSCTGNAADSFANAGGHYNPKKVQHPMHAGDLPVLMINNGVAWMAVYTTRFFPEDIIGKTVIVHGMPDDFRSQPSGDSGMKIACGEIMLWKADERGR